MDRCGQLWLMGVSKLADIKRACSDRGGQLWFLVVSLGWRTFDRQVRTTVVPGCLSKLADRCRTLVPGCISKLADIWCTFGPNSKM